MNTPPHIRFREARERRGLSQHELASQFGESYKNIYDLETFEDDLTCVYSPFDLRKFCRILEIHPASLFGDPLTESPISPQELVRLIHEECHKRNLTLDQFEDIVGWRLSACIEPPENLLEDMTIDGLQWLCRELRIDWRRAL